MPLHSSCFLCSSLLGFSSCFLFTSQRPHLLSFNLSYFLVMSHRVLVYCFRIFHLDISELFLVSFYFHLRINSTTGGTLFLLFPHFPNAYHSLAPMSNHDAGNECGVWDAPLILLVRSSVRFHSSSVRVVLKYVLRNPPSQRV